MKKLFSLLYLLCITLGLSSQNNSKGIEILDKAERSIQNSEGIRVKFESNNHGTFLMKGEKFYLNCAGIQTWYNGNTQWSYVEENDEVTITTPSLDELQSVNPYLLIKSYKKGYICKSCKKSTLNGYHGYEIVLIPNKNQDIASITLFISDNYRPLYIKFTQNNQSSIEFKVTSWEESKNLSDDLFIFNTNKFPNTEIIDLR